MLLSELLREVPPVLNRLEAKVLAGNQLSLAEALLLTALQGSQIYELLHIARRITLHFAGTGVDLCSIINAKSGRCSENCRYCAQSGHYQTEIDVYPLLDVTRVLDRAWEMEAAGARRFSIVISSRGPSKTDFAQILKIYRNLKKETSLDLCASLGIINEAQATQLAEAGVTMYHTTTRKPVAVISPISALLTPMTRGWKLFGL
jgi:biotin synthase